MSYSLFYSLLTNGVDLPIETVEKLHVRGITGDQLEIVGRVPFPFTFGNIKFYHHVLVVMNMRDILIIGNDLMDHRITIHQGHRITINQDGKEETIQLCREYPQYQLKVQNFEEIGPKTAKLVICKCGLTDQNGNIPDKVLLTGGDSNGLHIPRLVTEVNDESIYAVIENHSDDVYQLHPEQEIGKILPLQETYIGKQRVYETPDSNEGMHFLHDDILKEHILLGNEDSVLPIPHGYEEPDKDVKEIDFENI